MKELIDDLIDAVHDSIDLRNNEIYDAILEINFLAILESKIKILNDSIS